MAVVEFDYNGRTYRVDHGRYDSTNIHSLNLIRQNITLSTDLITDEKILVDWTQISVLRIVS
jgi:hypothetical protein